MNTQGLYSYASIRMNQIMNRMNENIENHITIVLWQINIMEKENNSKVHMSCTSLPAKMNAA